MSLHDELRPYIEELVEETMNSDAGQLLVEHFRICSALHKLTIDSEARVQTVIDGVLESDDKGAAMAQAVIEDMTTEQRDQLIAAVSLTAHMEIAVAADRMVAGAAAVGLPLDSIDPASVVAVVAASPSWRDPAEVEET